MKRHHTVVLALLACAAIAASNRQASAQGRANYRYAQNAAPPAARANVEELPPGRLVPTPANRADAGPVFVDEGYGPDHFHPGGDFYDHGGYVDGCCDSCGGQPCGGGCGAGCCGAGMTGCGSSRGQWFATADYLYVRAHFSEALSFVERELSQTTNTATTADTFHQLEFDYDSSYRVGGGWRSCDCGEEVRIMYTRLRSAADDAVVAPAQLSGTVVFLPFTPEALQPGDAAFINANVEVDSYDLEFRKTIPLGGTLGCGCGDACGCGDCCGCACPAWDITWSGGVRGAEVDWRRTYLLDATAMDTATNSTLRFEGAGPRTGLEGRRYFGSGGWFSIFMKGDLSLLLGHLEVDSVQFSSISATNIQLVETFRTRQIIPVTEIETGVSASITCNSSVSAGYMFSAWHDLGFRDQAAFPLAGEQLQVVSLYDDANILSFDGFFARVEFSY